MPRNGRPLWRTVSFRPRPCRAPHRDHGGSPRTHRRRAAPRDRAAHLVGIAGDEDRLIVRGLARRTLERLRGRVQVARSVIDDGNRHAGFSRPREQADDVGLSGAVERRCRRWRRRRCDRARSLDPSVEKAALGLFEIFADHDAAIVEAAARQFPPQQRRGLGADQDREQQRDPERPQSRRCRQRRSANATPPMISHIGDELKPQPVAQHPERRQQERPDMKSIAHETKARRVRQRVVVAIATISWQLVNRIDGHGFILLTILRGSGFALAPQDDAAGAHLDPSS